MYALQNYALGKWNEGADEGETLYNAIYGNTVATASSKGLNFAEMIDYARRVGNKNLRKLTFHERGRMLRALAIYLTERKETFYKISAYTGATRADSWVDIEGGIGNLWAYSSLRRQYPNLPFYIDGDMVPLSKGGSFIGHHICVPKEGVAIHINAYNFPVWGMLEKIAVNWLAGMPAIVKPATVTSYLTEAVAKAIIESEILPEGALQIVCGSARGILDHVNFQDVVTFTGSAETGRMLKSSKKIIEESVPFNMEADSLNACVLGKDVQVGSAEFEIFIKEVHREITTKCGQKCTAVRRIIVPENLVEAVSLALNKRLQSTIIGDPSIEGVRMGALAGLSQKNEVIEKIATLKKSQEIIYGNTETVEIKGGNAEHGAFLSPILMLNNNPFSNQDVHNVEAFGPVSTILPYSSTEEAIELVKLGKGSLVCSIITANDKIATEFVLGSASHHGRILILNNDCAKESTGHGSPMPLMVHGGPGRAGGGEEMGGKRGVAHYMQRTAIQGSPTTLTAITQIYQRGAKTNTDIAHPFTKMFDELEIGDQLITEKRLITSEDIDRFADLSGDKFYAHLTNTNFNGTMFTHQVAHGYFIISVAAGLFVKSFDINPVLLNYGIDELRFTKPVYPDTNIFVKLTCKEKISQETKPTDTLAKGIVKWQVEIFDETEEPLVGIGTILTMVKRIDDETI
jgi:oxepin-CoA hydrolase/3-oxo-5,6-dehydrosuberyl-CoA semialdehyde dehydrogenase